MHRVSATMNGATKAPGDHIRRPSPSNRSSSLSHGRWESEPPAGPSASNTAVASDTADGSGRQVTQQIEEAGKTESTASYAFDFANPISAVTDADQANLKFDSFELASPSVSRPRRATPSSKATSVAHSFPSLFRQTSSPDLGSLINFQRSGESKAKPADPGYPLLFGNRAALQEEAAFAAGSPRSAGGNARAHRKAASSSSIALGQPLQASTEIPASAPSSDLFPNRPPRLTGQNSEDNMRSLTHRQELPRKPTHTMLASHSPQHGPQPLSPTSQSPNAVIGRGSIKSSKSRHSLLPGFFRGSSPSLKGKDAALPASLPSSPSHSREGSPAPAFKSLAETGEKLATGGPLAGKRRIISDDDFASPDTLIEPDGLPLASERWRNGSILHSGLGVKLASHDAPMDEAKGVSVGQQDAPPAPTPPAALSFSSRNASGVSINESNISEGRPETRASASISQNASSQSDPATFTKSQAAHSAGISVRDLRPKSYQGLQSNDETLVRTTQQSSSYNSFQGSPLTTPKRMRPRPASLIASPSMPNVAGQASRRVHDEDDKKLDDAPRRRGKQRMSMLEFLRTDTVTGSGNGLSALDRSGSFSAPIASTSFSPFASSQPAARLEGGRATRDAYDAAPRSAGPAIMFNSSSGPETISATKAGKQRQTGSSWSGAAGEARPSPAAGAANTWTVHVALKPMTDSVTMFGTSQTTSKYSLSGSVVLTIPRKRRGTRGCEQLTFNREVSLSPANRHLNTESDAPVPSIALPDSPDAEEKAHISIRDEIHVKSIKLVFSGYSLYFDPAGRFSGLKLADVTQDLLPTGAKIPLDFDESSHDPLKYEIEFDISIPGCLPASIRTPFGATFYTLRSTVRYFNSTEAAMAASSTLTPAGMFKLAPGLNVSPPTRSSSAGSGEVDTSLASAALEASGGAKIALSSARSPSPMPASASAPAGMSLPLADPKQQPQAHAGASESRQKSKGGWLTKLIGASSSKSLEPSAASNESASTPQKHRKMRENSRLPSHPTDGSTVTESPIVPIIVRRCRDVVPIPVARMAHGEMEGIPTDPPPATRNARRVVPPRISSSSSEVPASSSEPDSQGAQRPATPAAPNSISAEETPEMLLPPSQPVSLARARNDSLALIPGLDSKRPALYGRRSSLTDQSSNGHLPPHPADDRPCHSSSNSSHAPMRHFLHRPVLHPPIEAGCSEEGLPFLLTVSVPTYVHTSGPQCDILNFGIQVDLNEHLGWNKVRLLGGLRLRHMELLLTQSERHSTLASRGFCFNFPLPNSPEVDIHDLPSLIDPMHTPKNQNLSTDELLLRRGYDRTHVETCKKIIAAGQQPDGEDKNVEIARTIVIGPPSMMKNENAEQPAHSKKLRKKSKLAGTGFGIDAVVQEQGPSSSSRVGVPSASGSSRLTREPASECIATPARPPAIPQTAIPDTGMQPVPPTSASREGDLPELAAAGRSAGPSLGSGQAVASGSNTSRRGRRLAQSAWSRLTGLANAVLEAGMDSFHDEEIERQMGEQSLRPHATYSFTGDDGHGVDLTKGRVRMTVNLPLITSRSNPDRSFQAAVLMADFEGPFARVRHKLQVKLGFGFGDKPLGEGEWGQALVMCVPVRFSEPPPPEVRHQFGATANRLAASTCSPFSVHQTPNLPAQTPVLPAYTQLFREDGSRLADEGEDLPRYPGHAAEMSRRGTISGPSPRPDGQPAGDAHWSMITASEVVDDSIDPDEVAASEAAAREHAQEFSEDSALDERVDIDTDLPDEERAREVQDDEDTVTVTPMFVSACEGAPWGTTTLR
ncbi:hypothetical protein K437DRAFT_100561 [Tilletiaria anomala UBC 951]|uniref:Uncharacterized protein n=1 Tax=Tilletiaria anomala (strain ATCC 24038 / CBS 436.72 / UBC 951) TaxID=1037660 RepID=A0A066W3K6_TILAU|nr:uncharacterized protein K437DRAFT_100561 [Tilletiaria anomala UBC 951]KDN47138.1 hypothetical protein K437DRAFT_100561 [Tilletiaria anomala UBC 951]